MKNDSLHAAMSTWAARDLPARLGAGDTAKLLGFAEHDIQVLMAVGKLTPLGDPAPNAPKWFAAIEVIQLATDRDWLNKATREVSKYWRQKHDRQQRLTVRSKTAFFRSSLRTARKPPIVPARPKDTMEGRLCGQKLAPRVPTEPATPPLFSGGGCRLHASETAANAEIVSQ
jgi:hypothetical protein